MFLHLDLLIDANVHTVSTQKVGGHAKKNDDTAFKGSALFNSAPASTYTFFNILFTGCLRPSSPFAEVVQHKRTLWIKTKHKSYGPTYRAGCVTDVSFFFIPRHLSRSVKGLRGMKYMSSKGHTFSRLAHRQSPKWRG